MNYIFYDLETNGLDYYTTGIMQISILDIGGNILLNQYTYPFDNRIDCAHIHGIDLKKLEDNKAITTIDLCTLIKKILRDKFKREDIYFIAYNNFGYDQIILENNFKISNVKMPDNWHFIDLFPIIKELYTIKPNYKLMTVFKNLCEPDDTIKFHCALDDSKCLYKLFLKIENKPNILYILNKYTRSSFQSGKILNSVISSLIGYNEKMLFETKNILIIGDMYKIFKDSNCNNENFELYLRNELNIYSKFHINNIIKQINIIHHFA